MCVALSFLKVIYSQKYRVCPLNSKGTAPYVSQFPFQVELGVYLDKPPESWRLSLINAKQ